MPTCPHCHTATLVKDGLNPSGSQRYTCKTCQRTHTPEPKPNGYPAAVREQAVRLYLQGMGIRAIGRVLNINHQSVTNWINRASDRLDAQPPQPAAADVIEMDELYTFVGQKKTNCI